MAGNKTGGKAAAKTNKAKYGSDFYARIGAIGGANGRGHAYAHGKVDPRVNGAKGGRKSSRLGIQNKKV